MASSALTLKIHSADFPTSINIPNMGLVSDILTRVTTWKHRVYSIVKVNMS